VTTTVSYQNSPVVTLLDALVVALTRAGAYNRNDQAPPVVVLWTDKERQWEPLLPLIRSRLPLLTLGEYAPSMRTGPAYWLRCMIARILPDDQISADATPIIYLPGVSRQELRAVEDCPRHLQPIAELQYRGAFWAHRNGKDWTVSGFFQSREGGLGIEVVPDQSTREALRRALPRLANETIASLRHESPLRAAFLNALLNPDDVRRVLNWLNDPETYRIGLTDAEWRAFCSLCQEKYRFYPETDGPLTAASQLAQRNGIWEVVWQRFTESPWLYPRLPETLEHARPPQQRSLFDDPQVWPQDNAAAEESLRRRLLELRERYEADARDAIARLEDEHSPRRSWVWAKLDRSPLAGALQHLAALASLTARPLSGSSLGEMANAYTEWGWRADAAFIDALASVERSEDINAVVASALATYRPWLEGVVTKWQQLYATFNSTTGTPPLNLSSGTCVLFSDALRFDVAMHLNGILNEQGYVCQTRWHLAALPTITPTAKSAIAPISGRIVGAPSGLTPLIRDTGQRVTADNLRRALEENGFQILRGEELGDATGRAWTELGAIDSYGHQHGWRLARHLDGEIRALGRRIEALLTAGWKQVVVVTDHGWLLLPGGLPKADLPEYLTDLRKGRCARLKPFSETSFPTVPWYWDPNVRIAVAPGICCFEMGKEYEHGGLSPQECVVPIVTVTHTAREETTHPVIDSIAWRGLRCVISLSGTTEGIAVDIRTKPGDSHTSLTGIARTPSADGTVSLLVENEEREGEAALVVVISTSGTILAQTPTIIGG
jgi:hypothetical protein